LANAVLKRARATVRDKIIFFIDFVLNVFD
jgi:hypothetical protein